MRSVRPATDVLAGGSHPAHSTVNGSPFPPIADYGFLSDCEVSALVAPERQHRVDVPAADGRPEHLRGAILDRGAGSFRLGPADVPVPAGRRYLPGTMVLETTWATPDGWAVVRDVLLIGPWRHEAPPIGRAPAGARRPRAPSGCCCAPSGA